MQRRQSAPGRWSLCHLGLQIDDLRPQPTHLLFLQVYHFPCFSSVEITLLRVIRSDCDIGAEMLFLEHVDGSFEIVHLRASDLQLTTQIVDFFDQCHVFLVESRVK